MAKAPVNRVKSGQQSADDPMEFILSTESVDRDGDILVQSGWDLKSFRKNPIALFGHNHGNPIGTWSGVRISGKQLIGRLTLAKQGTSQVVDEVRSLIEQRILRTVSVGFSSSDAAPIDEDNPWGGIKFSKMELHEASIVAVPANPEAVSLAKSLGISEETRTLVFRSTNTVSGVKDRKTTSRSLSAAPSNPKSKGSPMKIGDKIVAASEHLEKLRDQVADIVKAADDEGRDLHDEETDQIGALEGEIESAEKSLNGLKSAEKALAHRTQKQTTTKPNLAPAVAKANEKASDLIFKMAHVQLRSFVEKKSPEVIVNERYGHDERVGAVMKSASTVAYTNVAGWAQELTDTAVRGFIDELKPVSIYGALAAAGVAIPFGNDNAVTMPRRTGPNQVPGSFVGEGNSIPVKQGQFGSVTFNRYKAAVITAFSKELTRVSNPQIESLMRDAILLDTGMMLDSVLMDPSNSAIAGIRPASPWFGSASQVSAGDTLENILADIRFLFSTLSDANAGRNPRIVMNPARLTGLSMLTNANGSFVFRDEIAQGRLMGVQLIVSTNCPPTEVYIIDAPDFGTAFGTPEFEASEQATLVMLNDDGTDPTMADTNAINAAGSVHVSDAAGVVGGPAQVRSMFQTWETALRMVMPVSWGMMREGTVAHVSGVTW